MKEEEEKQQRTLSALLKKQQDLVRASFLGKQGRRIELLDPLSKLPQAAVLMLLAPRMEAGELSMLLIKRNQRDNDPWSGHMAFPGGRKDPKDPDILATALREVAEETNIDVEDCTILGTLDELLPRSASSLRVTPFVAMAEKQLTIQINEKEIAEYFWIPLSFFSNPSNRTTYVAERPQGKVTFPAFYYNNKYIIWGMTERMITDFFQKIDRPL